MKKVMYNSNISDHNLNHEQLVKKFFISSGRTATGLEYNPKEYKSNYDRAIRRIESEYNAKLDNIIYLVKNYIEKKDSEEFKSKLQLIGMKYRIYDLLTGNVTLEKNLMNYCRNRNWNSNNYRGIIKSIKEGRKYKNIFVEIL